jgi:hypothetical protein
MTLRLPGPFFPTAGYFINTAGYFINTATGFFSGFSLGSVFAENIEFS